MKRSNTTNNGWEAHARTRYIYNGWNLVAEYAVDGGGSLTLTRSYTWGLDLSGSQSGAGGVGGLLAIHDAATSTSYGTAYDGNGNLTALIKRTGSGDANGTIAAAYEYSGFGETIRASGDYRDLNPFRFSTKYTDNETGLVYYGMRYFDPANGRFLGRDSIGEAGGRNLYGFCGNNGINRWDLLGNLPSLEEMAMSLGDYGEYWMDPERYGVSWEQYLDLNGSSIRQRFIFERGDDGTVDPEVTWAVMNNHLDSVGTPVQSDIIFDGLGDVVGTLVNAGLNLLGRVADILTPAGPDLSAGRTAVVTWGPVRNLGIVDDPGTSDVGLPTPNTGAVTDSFSSTPDSGTVQATDVVVTNGGGEAPAGTSVVALQSGSVVVVASGGGETVTGAVVVTGSGEAEPVALNTTAATVTASTGPDWGQFGKGAASLGTGILGAVTLAGVEVATGGLATAGVVVAAGTVGTLITHGLGNMVAAFSPDRDLAARMLNWPATVPQYIARALFGQSMQDLVGIAESANGLRGFNQASTLERTKSAVELAESVRSAADNARQPSPQPPPTRTSPQLANPRY